MFPLRDLQDDLKHEELQGLREKAVLQRVSVFFPSQPAKFHKVWFLVPWLFSSARFPVTMGK